MKLLSLSEVPCIWPAVTRPGSAASCSLNYFWTLVEFLENFAMTKNLCCFSLNNLHTSVVHRTLVFTSLKELDTEYHPHLPQSEGGGAFFNFTFYHCIVPVGFLLWEIQVAFPRKSQPPKSCATQPTAHAGCLSNFHNPPNSDMDY